MTSEYRSKNIKDQITYFKECYISEFGNSDSFQFTKTNTSFLKIYTIDNNLFNLSSGIKISKEESRQIRNNLYQGGDKVDLLLGFLGVNISGDLTPLLVYHCKNFWNSGKNYIEINFDSLQVNESVCKQITSSELDALELEKLLETYLSGLPITDETINEIEIIVDKYDHEKKYSLSKKMVLAIYGAKVNSKGIKRELQKLADSTDKNYSQPIKDIFSSKPLPSNKTKISTQYFPIILSDGQKNIVHCLENYTNSLLYGPPGTGKSHTIAAIALEAIRSGKSVLITSKADHALSVIEQKIKAYLKEDRYVIEYGRSGYRAKLKSILNGYINKRTIKPLRKKDINSKRNFAKKTTTEITKQENELIDMLYSEQKYGEAHFAVNSSLLDKVSGFFSKYYLRDHNKLAKVVSRLKKAYKRHEFTASSLIRNEQEWRLFNNYTTISESLIDFKNSLFANNINVRRSSKEKVDYTGLIRVLPIWIVKLSDLEKCLPLEKELFDYVIIDEASQVDISSALPALQRAKKVLVSGDPKQLKFISFLSKEKSDYFLRENNLFESTSLPYLNYREFSILDLIKITAKGRQNIAFLNEHYRSQPSIIHFNNHHFYNNQLNIMTSHGSHKGDDRVEVKYIHGKESDKTNDDEISLIIDAISNYITAEKDHVNKSSIGIISPFRNQSIKIRKHILETFSLETINNHKLRVGTPYEFQGDEKEVIFISLVLDNNSSSGSFGYLSRENVINVLTSRAKSKQYIYLSFDLEKVNKSSIVYSLISKIPKYNQFKIEVYDIFAQEVVDHLQPLVSSKIEINENVIGIPIDILIPGTKHDLCIDLLGYEGLLKDFINLYEIEKLFRADKYIYFLPYRLWMDNRKKILRDIIRYYKYINQPTS